MYVCVSACECVCQRCVKAEGCVRERECVEVGWRKSILLMAGCYSQLEVVMDKIINPLRPFEFHPGSELCRILF